MKRFPLLAATFALAALLSSAGCTGNTSKGINKDQDRPKSTPDTRR